MNLLEIGLSFAEGLALIASPCILPVLPLVLSTSAEGGRGRPFGIITGFVLAFCAIALLSRKLVLAFGIDLDIIKHVSLVLLALLGLVLLSEKLSQAFSALTQGAANVGGTLSANAKGGYVSGIAIGALIGLVWTPCAGPILASVLVQVIRQQTDAASLLIVAAFALGAGVPMLIIALVGRRIVGRLGFFTRHADAVRKAFGVLILLSVALLASGYDFSAPAQEQAPVRSRSGLEDALEAPYSAPEFAGNETWLNGPPQSMATLKGKVVLVDFWTYSCINCLRTLPYLTAWDAKYRNKGLVIIGVHAPEFEFEKKRANVEAALAKYSIRYPVALDNKLDTWTAFNNRYWPAHYLIDRNGQVVYTHFGEGNYARTEHNIRTLLGLEGEAETQATAPTFSTMQTPETYLGYARAERFEGGALPRDTETVAHFPAKLPLHGWALQGAWQISAEHITSAAAKAALRLHFAGKKVFLVLGSASGEPITARLMLNGQVLAAEAGKDAPNGTLTAAGHRLYELVNLGKTGEGQLEIVAAAPGLEAYAFTFGE